MDPTTRPGDTGHTTDAASGSLQTMTTTAPWQPPIGMLVALPPRPTPPPRDTLGFWFPQENLKRATIGYRLAAQLLCLAVALLGLWHHYQLAFAVAVPAGFFLFIHGVVCSYRESREDAIKAVEAEVAAATEDFIADQVAAAAPCGIDNQTPGRADAFGYIYVIRFSTGVVKVGQTNHPRRRIGEHGRDAAPFGVRITSYWVSPAHRNFSDNEAHLIAMCHRRGANVRKEYFTGISYEDAVLDACGLPFLPFVVCRGGAR